MEQKQKLELSHYYIPTSMQPDVRYLIQLILLDQTILVWNMKGLRHYIAKMAYFFFVKMQMEKNEYFEISEHSLYKKWKNEYSCVINVDNLLYSKLDITRFGSNKI